MFKKSVGVLPSPAELRRQRIEEIRRRRVQLEQRLDEEEELLSEQEEVKFLEAELREVRKLRHQGHASHP